MVRPLVLSLALSFACARHQRPGVFLEELSWVQAEPLLTPDAVVIIPIGAASKEHGPHLKLSNDAKLARYLADRLAERVPAVFAPAVPYHYYPAFLDYPGSTSLQLSTARDLLIDICKSLAHHGPRRFYALNTGVSTVRALKPAAEELAKEGILLRYTDLLATLGPITKGIEEQPRGTHADEIETSMLLVIDPASVDMSKAVRQVEQGTKGPLTRTRADAGTYSPSGVYGDATLATREKGQRVLDALVEALVRDVESMRAAGLQARQGPRLRHHGCPESVR